MVLFKYQRKLITKLINYGLIKEDDFIITLMQKWVDENDTLMYSTHNEENLVIAEGFI